jgi:ATP-dependent RNA helicase RhlB
VDDIGFVINFDFPYAPEDYVHRIGRTGRAGASGVAISFADEDESFTIPEIEKFINEELKCTMLKHDDPLLAPIPKVSRHEHHREQPVEAGKAPTVEPVQDMIEVSDGEDQAPASAYVTETSPLPSAPVVVEVASCAMAEVVEPVVVASPVPEKPPRVEEVQADKPVKVEKPVEHKLPHFTRPPAHAPVAAPQVAPSAPRPATPGRPARFSEEWVPGGEK